MEILASYVLRDTYALEFEHKPLQVLAKAFTYWGLGP